MKDWVQIILIILICFLLLVGGIVAIEYHQPILEKYWKYKATKEPHKYGVCKKCGILKPHKIMDTNIMTCYKCMGLEGYE